MNFFKKMGVKIKLMLGSIAGVIGLVLFFFIRSKIRATQKMNYELSRVKSEIEIANLEEDSVEKTEKIVELKMEETLIREKIKFLEETEASEGREVSMEELNAFFDDMLN